MAIFFGNDSATYTNLRPLTEREDADGKIWVYARAEASATAGHPQILRIDQNGWKAFQIYDTGLATITAAGQVGYKIGIPVTTIPSDSDGWVQVGGYAAMIEESVNASAGNLWYWKAATTTCSNLTAASAPSAAGLNGVFAVNMNTASGAAYDVFLMNKWVSGIT